MTCKCAQTCSSDRLVSVHKPAVVLILIERKISHVIKSFLKSTTLSGKFSQQHFKYFKFYFIRWNDPTKKAL